MVTDRWVFEVVVFVEEVADDDVFDGFVGGHHFADLALEGTADLEGGLLPTQDLVYLLPVLLVVELHKTRADRVLLQMRNWIFTQFFVVLTLQLQLHSIDVIFRIFFVEFFVDVSDQNKVVVALVLFA